MEEDAMRPGGPGSVPLLSREEAGQGGGPLETASTVAAKLRRMRQICDVACSPGPASSVGSSARAWIAPDVAPSASRVGSVDLGALSDLSASSSRAERKKALQKALRGSTSVALQVRAEPYVPPLAIPMPRQAWQHVQEARSNSKEAGLPRRSPVSSNASTAGEDHDILQFSAPIYFVEEDEEVLWVDIMRLGSMRGTVCAQWSTEDDSAKAGVRYQAAAGTVIFQDGEHTKSVQIKIIDSDHFASTLELKVRLSNPQNCELGKYLHFARVKIIDKDLFPSSKYREEIEGGAETIEEIPAMGLLLEYCRLNYDAEGMPWRTALYVLLSQVPNAYVLLQLLLNQYIVDVLFSDKPEATEKLFVPDRRVDAMILGAMFVVPMFAVTLADVVRVNLDVKGLSRKFIQENLFRKYLHFTEQSRSLASDSMMQVALSKDAEEVCHGYMGFLELLQRLGKLFILSYFILSENPSALPSIILMTVLMLVFVYFRSSIVTEKAEHATHKATRLIGITNEACRKYRLICEYMQRPQFCDIFAEAGHTLSEAEVTAELAKTLNDYFPKWLGPVFIGFYVAFQADSVFTGDLSLGTFLATIRIYVELSEELSSGYKTLMKLAAATGPLRKLTWLFNLETDVRMRKSINRQKRELTKVAREGLLGRSDSKNSSADDGASTGTSGTPELTIPESTTVARGQFKTDLIPIQCINVGFTYPGATQPVLHDVNIKLQQGKVVAVVGEHGAGKATFMRMIAGMTFPTEGLVFVPTHLRVLQVGHDPCILDLSVMQNLRFGAASESLPRLREVLQLLEMPKTLRLIEEMMSEKGDDVADDSGKLDFGEQQWQHTLNYVEQAKLHLARALIMNPEVLICHRPLIHYDEQSTAKVHEILVRFVRNNGLALPEETAFRRRPRTCIFTPTSRMELKDVDVIWRVKGGKVTQVSREEVNNDDMT